MAVELCSENSGTSPRISFSHDLCHFDVVPVEQRPLRSKSSGLDSSIDFDFCVRESFEQESSSADELFSDGKILPTKIKKKDVPSKQTDQSLPPQPLPRSNSVHEEANNVTDNSKKESWKENKITRDETVDEVDEKQNSKSFWRFKRSSSLNCGSGYGRSLCPLLLLSRSYSTGSTPNVKQASISKDSHNHKQNSHKHANSSSYKSSTSYQKPPLRKSYKPYGNVVRVNPVLNVPSGNLFGLGSIFFNGKDKNHKKK
ncbi:uncharacterized protein LOC111306306 [Durio zibethinus]|uniref:Uncharacterized protein LOC111306306 n=1 Tax=Durio zibethinus TaxID=66656 RepID=A0A6P6A5B1_DURZI|nr:uncharacterized protein LOC111306306 [Durio zibethinus]